MLTPSCQHLLDKLDGISSDVLWNLGDESVEVYSKAYHEFHMIVSKLHFEADHQKILALIEYLSKELMHPSQPKYRKEGGLSGFVVLTITLRKAFASQLLHKILPPVLDSLHDFDSSVRRFACETLCEIARVVERGIIMFFDRIAFVFSLRLQDLDTETKDMLTKIVKFAATEDGELRMEEFINFLKGRMRKIHYVARVFLLNWIQINSQDLINEEWFLSEFIDAWFHDLSVRESDEREKASQELAEILSHLRHAHINEFRKLGKHQLASHYSDVLAVILPCFSNTPENICEIAREINEGILEVYPVSAERLNINAVLSVLTRGLRFGWKDSQIEALRWIIKLLSWHRAEVISYFSENFDCLIKALPDSSDEVLLLVLEVCASIVGDAEHFHRLFAFLVQKFHTDFILERRGFLIVSHLCALLNAEQVYRKFSSLIEGEDNLEFASKFVQTLNFVLVTSSKLADMRALLKQTLVNAAGKDLFLSLYSSWCHCASATISLCLLAQAYRHANCVILSLSEEEIMMPLIGVTSLVLWLELPSFDHIKLQLLEDEKSVWLRKLLYRLVMLLPQDSVAFDLLSSRLGSLPKRNSVSARFECASCGHQHLETLQLADPDDENQDTGNTQDAINFASLLEQFMDIQRKHFNHAKTKAQPQPRNSGS